MMVLQGMSPATITFLDSLLTGSIGALPNVALVGLTVDVTEQRNDPISRTDDPFFMTETEFVVFSS